MKIYLDTSRYGRSIVIEDTNVRIDEDVEERLYKYTADGKIEHTKGYESCITDEAMTQMVTLLSDMVYDRVRPYNGEDLIKQLAKKITPEDRIRLWEELLHEYEDEFLIANYSSII